MKILLIYLLGSKATETFLNSIRESSSLYDLFNLITDKAKGYEINRRAYLEKLAGDLDLLFV